MSADEPAPDGVDLERIDFLLEHIDDVDEGGGTTQVAHNARYVISTNHAPALVRLARQQQARIAILTARCGKLAGLVEDGYREAMGHVPVGPFTSGEFWYQSDTRAELERLTKEETDDE